MNFTDLSETEQAEIINSLKPNTRTPACIVLCGEDAGGALMFDPLILSPRAAIKRNPGAFISLMMEMSEAYLSEANLRGADLSGTRFNWTQHTLVGEVLHQAADDWEEIKFSLAVKGSSPMCWDDWKKTNDPLLDWAFEALAGFVRDGDNAPDFLRNWNDK